MPRSLRWSIIARLSSRSRAGRATPSSSFRFAPVRASTRMPASRPAVAGQPPRRRSGAAPGPPCAPPRCCGGRRRGSRRDSLRPTLPISASCGATSSAEFTSRQPLRSGSFSDRSMISARKAGSPPSADGRLEPRDALAHRAVGVALERAREQGALVAVGVVAGWRRRSPSRRRGRAPTSPRSRASRSNRRRGRARDPRRRL